MTTSPSRHHQLRLMQLTLAGAAAIAMFAMVGKIQAADATPVRLTDFAVTAPGGGLATDSNDDWINQQNQLNQQQLQQSMQQAEEQNEQAQQQFIQDMQQAQMDQQQANQ
jgi:hypothetical protein